MLWLAPLLGFILTIPSFFSGYMLDGHFLKQNTLASSIYHQRPIWDYFNFVSTEADVEYYRERGILLSWWSADTFRNRFFRPITSLVHAFLFRFFADAPWIMHVGLALLYALLIFLCVQLLIKFSSSSIAAGIGMLLFAVNDTHAYSTGWISAYNSMLCCVFGLSALLMHERWRRQKSASGLFMFIAAFLLSLLCSEGGLALMGYLFAYALFREPGSLRKKMTSLIPGLIIAVGYVIFYSMQHYGVKESGVYQSPADDPWGSIFPVLYKTAMFVQSQIYSLPPLTIILQSPLLGQAGVAVGVLLLVGCIIIFRNVFFANKNIAFFFAGMVLSIVPFALGPLQDRLLLWSGLGDTVVRAAVVR